MGSPAITWFCRNGHIAQDVPHHYISNDPTKCPFCDSTEFRSVAEWNNGDYCEPSLVPCEPLDYEEKQITVRIPVYDVFELFYLWD